MDLSEIRNQIDAIDAQLINLLKQRLEASARVAAYKREHNLPLTDPTRERAVLNRAEELAGEGMTNYVRAFFETLFDISKHYQARLLDPKSAHADMIQRTIDETEKAEPMDSRSSARAA